MDPIRIFVGTDKWQQAAGAELVLEHSIRQHSQRADIEITWMRTGDRGWKVSKLGGQQDGELTWRVGDAVDRGWVNNRSWGTPFTGFRFAVPQLCQFEGRAIYLDADMLVLGDIADLWNEEIEETRGLKCWGDLRTDVSVINCEFFGEPGGAPAADWPVIAEMKDSGWRAMDYLRMLHRMGAVDNRLDRMWNDCDGWGYERGENTQLIHYTHVLHGQPYRPYDIPYPKEFPYVKTSKKAGLLWWDTYLQALMKQHGEEEGTRIWNEAKNA